MYTCNQYDVNALGHFFLKRDSMADEFGVTKLHGDCRTSSRHECAEVRSSQSSRRKTFWKIRLLISSSEEMMKLVMLLGRWLQRKTGIRGLVGSAFIIILHTMWSFCDLWGREVWMSLAVVVLQGRRVHPIWLVPVSYGREMLGFRGEDRMSVRTRPWTTWGCPSCLPGCHRCLQFRRS